MSINEFAIKLVKSKQVLYGPTYNLKLVTLQILITYIKNYLKTILIESFKSFINILIVFNLKLDKIFHFCIDY